jgi:protein-L-isoaspartate(D-aspartate) O-methyltransferase
MAMSNDFSLQRSALVEQMKRSGVLRSKSVERAFLKVKRELFFPPGLNQHAYADSAFPIGCGQTISQPSTIAIMLEMLGARAGMRVLEVGAGSCYVIALLCEIVGGNGMVFGIELIGELKDRALTNLGAAKTRNFELTTGDGTLGWKEKAPFDRILVSAACRQIPAPLAEQLKEGGRIVAPLGGRLTQEIACLEKKKAALNEIARECCFAFVPLRGKFGF